MKTKMMGGGASCLHQGVKNRKEASKRRNSRRGRTKKKKKEKQKKNQPLNRPDIDKRMRGKREPELKHGDGKFVREGKTQGKGSSSRG